MERENNKQKEMSQLFFFMAFLLFNTCEHAYILTRDHEETHALPVCLWAQCIARLSTTEQTALEPDEGLQT